MQAQPHKGKLHTERDNDLRDIVMRQIEWEPEVESQDISVDARNGAVTLTGVVHGYFEKIAAERAAKAVFGVKAIVNDIEVKPMTRTDPEIARDILEVLRLDATVPDRRIKVAISNGLVTLEGTVDWNFQRDAAESCARKVHGVRGVSNLIHLVPTASPTAVKLKIEEALKRSAEVNAGKILVSAVDGTITLAGKVRSFFERDEAERVAWAAPGVTHVIDHIAVIP